MGYYLETLHNQQKARQLVEMTAGAARIIPKPEQFLPSGEEVLVCVVDNGLFEAAGIIYDEHEFADFSHPDGRPRIWMLVPRTEVLRQCPYVEEILK